MAFVCTANSWLSNILLIGDAVIIGIGYDDDAPASYSLLISFDVMAGGDLELFFCVIKVDNVDGTETRYWSGLEVARFASREQRADIRLALAGGLTALLQSILPHRVFCCTHDENLPEPALRKHLLVAETFEMCGYEVRLMPLCLGKHSWWMERRE
jgi:hypothetical protein